jgi:hypothetical protein
MSLVCALLSKFLLLSIPNILLKKRLQQKTPPILTAVYRCKENEAGSNAIMSYPRRSIKGSLHSTIGIAMTSGL